MRSVQVNGYHGGSTTEDRALQSPEAELDITGSSSVKVSTVSRSVHRSAMQCASSSARRYREWRAGHASASVGDLSDSDSSESSSDSSGESTVSSSAMQSASAESAVAAAGAAGVWSVGDDSDSDMIMTHLGC